MMVDQDLLERMGIEVLSTQGDELYAHCPQHAVRTGKVDADPSWSINADTGVFFCFSCRYRGSLPRLVADMLGFQKQLGERAYPDYDAAQEWLDGNREVSPGTMLNLLAKARRVVTRRRMDVPMGESRLALFIRPPKWALKSRRLSAEACADYGVLWNPKRESWITPIRDPFTFDLMGWQEKAAEGRWFRNFPPGVAKRRTLFGIERYDSGQMVVVESPLDAVRMATAGVAGAVSSYGAAVSEEQLYLMRGASPLIFALDNPAVDKAGLESSKELLKLAQREGLPCWFFRYPDDGVKDPGDMTAAGILAGIDRRMNRLLGMAAILPDSED